MPKHTFAGEPGPGRPRGCKNKISGSAKASVKSVLEEIATENPLDIKAAILKGIKSRPPHSLRYIEVMAHYVDGRPAETVKLEGMKMPAPIQIVLAPEGVENHGDD